MRDPKGGVALRQKCGTIGLTGAERKLILRLRSLGDGVHLLAVIREKGDCREISVLSDGSKLEKLNTKTQ